MAIFTVEWALVATGYRAVVDVANGAEAIRTARAVYAALYCAVGNAGGGDAPAVFSEIKRKACTRTSAEPANRAFIVTINKRSRKHDH